MDEEKLPVSKDFARLALEEIARKAIANVTGQPCEELTTSALTSTGSTATPPGTWDANEAKDDSEGSCVPEACKEFEELQLHPDYAIYDVNMYDNGAANPEIVKNYYKCCVDNSAAYANMIVTTSCFSAWRKVKKVNKAGKVIPAIPNTSPLPDEVPTRAFFFDDNINLHLGGGADIEGICNLRDIKTGEFVDFTVGKNGFVSERFFRFTMVHYSTEYRNVLIQANIIDAMTHPDYFIQIISRFARPEEKLLVFADVNGTVVWDDTVIGKTSADVLLSTMFTFAEVWPRTSESPANFTWESKPSVSVEKRQDLRSFVNQIANKDEDWYRNFWHCNKCEAFLDALVPIANVGWSRGEKTIDTAEFMAAYKENADAIANSAPVDGIPHSWFKCYEFLVSKGHTVVLNSFGVDTFRVVRCCVPDASKVLQMTFNYGMWSARDVSLWTAQFSPQEVPKTPP